MSGNHDKCVREAHETTVLGEDHDLGAFVCDESAKDAARTGAYLSGNRDLGHLRRGIRDLLHHRTLCGGVVVPGVLICCIGAVTGENPYTQPDGHVSRENLFDTRLPLRACSAQTAGERTRHVADHLTAAKKDAGVGVVRVLRFREHVEEITYPQPGDDILVEADTDHRQDRRQEQRALGEISLRHARRTCTGGSSRHSRSDDAGSSIEGGLKRAQREFRCRIPQRERDLPDLRLHEGPGVGDLLDTC